MIATIVTMETITTPILDTGKLRLMALSDDGMATHHASADVEGLITIRNGVPALI
jgi:hypothetical protein